MSSEKRIKIMEMLEKETNLLRIAKEFGISKQSTQVAWEHFLYKPLKLL